MVNAQPEAKKLTFVEKHSDFELLCLSFAYQHIVAPSAAYNLHIYVLACRCAGRQLLNADGGVRAPRGLGGIINNFAPVVHRSQRAQLPHHQPQQGERLDAQAAIQVAEYNGERLNICSLS